jgi:hypothetical protein
VILEIRGSKRSEGNERRGRERREVEAAFFTGCGPWEIMGQAQRSGAAETVDTVSRVVD